MNPIRFEVRRGALRRGAVGSVGAAAADVVAEWASGRGAVRVDLRGSGQVECVVMTRSGSVVQCDAAACEPDAFSITVPFPGRGDGRRAAEDALWVARAWFRRFLGRADHWG